MFESTATLYSEAISQDANLNEVRTFEGRQVLVRATRSINRSEFYQAAAQGLKPAAVLVLFFADYNGEQVLKWNGTTYRITRTYQKPDSDNLELTIEEALEFRDGIPEGGESS